MNISEDAHLNSFRQSFLIENSNEIKKSLSSPHVKNHWFLSTIKNASASILEAIKRQESVIPERLEIQRISQSQELLFLMTIKDLHL